MPLNPHSTEPKRACLNLISHAHQKGLKVLALIPSDFEKNLKTLTAAGAREVFMLPLPGSRLSPLKAVHFLMETLQFLKSVDLVLASHGLWHLECLSRLSVRLNSSFASDVLGFSPLSSPQKGWQVQKPLFSGKCLASRKLISLAPPVILMHPPAGPCASPRPADPPPAPLTKLSLPPPPAP